MRTEHSDPVTLETMVRTISSAIEVRIGHSEPLGHNELLKVSWGPQGEAPMGEVALPAGLLLGKGVYAGRVRPRSALEFEYENEAGEKRHTKVPFSVLAMVIRALVAAELREKMHKSIDEHVAHQYLVDGPAPIEAKKKRR